MKAMQPNMGSEQERDSDQSRQTKELIPKREVMSVAWTESETDQKSGHCK